MRGVSEAAVRKAIKYGRISLEPDGTIDPDRADREWAARTDPSQQRGAHAPAEPSVASASREEAIEQREAELQRQMAELEAAEAARRAAGSPRAAVREVVEADPDPVGGGGDVSFAKARIANMLLQAQLAKLRIQRQKGELVDRSRAVALVFDLARRERDAWIGWPARVAANMAAELGVDAHHLTEVLDRYLREHLAELSEIKVDFGKPK